jgi:hypothetical protein
MISNIFVFNSCYFPLNNQTAFWNRLKSSKDSRDLEKLKNCIFLLLLFYCLFWDLKVDLNVKLKWPDQTRSNRGSIANEEKWNWDNIVFTKTVFVFVRENQVFTQKLLYQQEITCDMNIELCLLSAFCCFSNITALKFR